MAVAAVQEPAGDLEFRVEAGAERDEAVGSAGTRGRVGGQRLLAGRAERRDPVEVEGRVADPQRAPLDDAVDEAVAVLTDDEHPVGGEGSVDDGGLELPERVVLDGRLPALPDGGREEPRLGGAGHDAVRVRPDELGGQQREARFRDEGRREGVDRGDRGTERVREDLVAAERGRVEVTAGHEVEHHGASAVDGQLAHDGRGVEGQPAADTGRECAKGDEVRGLLRLGLL